MSETGTNAPNANSQRPPELPPVFSKKELYFFLFPNNRQYQSSQLRRVLFCEKNMSLVGIDPIKYPRIKMFTVEQCAAIRRLLQSVQP